jgi:DNA-binding GntR family transcriptional regulator
VDKPVLSEVTLIEQARAAPHPTQHKLLSRTVADWLADRIIAGEEPPGTRLTETKLAGLAGVSRSPVREALRLLAGEGLVEIVPRIGAQVARVGSEDVTQLYACRMLLEPTAAGLSAAAVSDAGLDELDLLRSAMERAVATRDPRRFLAENIAYFRALLAHCPNDVLRELVDLTWNRAMRYWSIFARLSHYPRGSLEHHSLLHEAVHARDRDAAARADHAILERALNEILVTLSATGT